MTPQEIYHSLSELKTVTYGSLMDYVQREEAKDDNHGFLKWLEDENDPFPRFSVGDHIYILKGEIMAMAGALLFTTYKAVPNLDDYPKTRLEHIPSMDVRGETSGFLLFKTQKSINRYGKEIDATVIHDFGQEYVEQLKEYITTVEQP